MRVLVSGGAGFLGSHLVDQLLSRGDEVVVFDDLSRGHREQVPDGVILVEGDVRDSTKWNEICAQYSPELIHHLAAVNGTRRFHREADLVVDVNVNGTRNAIEAAKATGARLVFYSSPESFGEQSVMPLADDSNSVFTPAHEHQRHSYGASKYLGELLIHHAIRDFGLDARIVRPFNAYGPRLHGDADGQVVSMMLLADPIEVHGDGLQTRSMTWVGDVVEGMLRIGDLPNLCGMAFNLASEEEVSMHSLASMISEITGAEIVHTEANQGDSRRRVADLSGNDE
ncbi:MAG: NAD-dependent epimerase/dehydratase family protein, partial [Candidatus Poseidoniaceae archaeon]|nr:NAD-dependent epimerase/dehydratase family protein [Candidatus Poseidoniaceae archaeon]